jgi:hypothetical protein
MGAHTERGNEMEELIGMVMSAAKAKAPIVAIPREGLAPICLRSKLLKGALKGVKIHSVTVLDHGWLQIRGMDGQVRTCSKFAPLNRPVALKELSKWSEREREKHNKRVLMGDTVKSLPKRAKSYEYALDGDEAVAITLRKPDLSTFTHRGIPIQLDAMPGYEFVLHAAGEPGEHYEWRVTERSSGICAGKGDTAAKAIESAESNWRKCDAAAMERAKQMIADNQLPAVVEVAA